MDSPVCLYLPNALHLFTSQMDFRGQSQTSFLLKQCAVYHFVIKDFFGPCISECHLSQVFLIRYAHPEFGLCACAHMCALSLAESG